MCEREGWALVKAVIFRVITLGCITSAFIGCRSVASIVIRVRDIQTKEPISKAVVEAHAPYVMKLIPPKGGIDQTDQSGEVTLYVTEGRSLCIRVWPPERYVNNFMVTFPKPQSEISKESKWISDTGTTASVEIKVDLLKRE